MEPGEVVRPGQGHVNDQTLPFSTGVLLGQLGPTMDLLRNVSTRRVLEAVLGRKKTGGKMERRRELAPERGRMLTGGGGWGGSGPAERLWNVNLQYIGIIFF